MFRNGMILFKSEFIRLIKYRIIPISLAVSIIWMVTIYFIGEDASSTFASLFIALDASVMSLLMIGTSLFFEREENTLKPLLVTPISIHTILIVKLISTIYIAMQSAILVSLFVYFVMGISLNFIGVFISVIIIALVHGLIGFYLSMKSLDFTAFLVSMIIYTVSFGLPSLLIGLNVLPEWLEVVLVVSPMHVSMIYLNAAFQLEGALGIFSLEVILGTLWMMLVSYYLFKNYVSKNYAFLAVKE